MRERILEKGHSIDLHPEIPMLSSSFFLERVMARCLCMNSAKLGRVVERVMVHGSRLFYFLVSSLLFYFCILTDMGTCVWCNSLAGWVTECGNN